MQLISLILDPEASIEKVFDTFPEFKPDETRWIRAFFWYS